MLLVAGDCKLLSLLEEESSSILRFFFGFVGVVNCSTSSDLSSLVLLLVLLLSMEVGVPVLLLLLVLVVLLSTVVPPGDLYEEWELDWSLGDLPSEEQEEEANTFHD